MSANVREPSALKVVDLNRPLKRWTGVELSATKLPSGILLVITNKFGRSTKCSANISVVVPPSTKIAPSFGICEAATDAIRRFASMFVSRRSRKLVSCGLRSTAIAPP